MYIEPHILYDIEPFISFDWLVCKHVLTGLFELKSRTQTCKYTDGQTLLRCQDRLHQVENSINYFEYKQLTCASKILIINASAHMCILDNISSKLCRKSQMLSKLRLQ